MPSTTPRRSPPAAPDTAHRAARPTRAPAARAARGRAYRALAAAGAAAALAGCGQDLLEAASVNNIPNVRTLYVAYPYSSAPASLPTALSISGLTAVRPSVVVAQVLGGTPVNNFDFVVDRGADGRVRLVPSKLIVDLTGAARVVLRTGLLVVNTPFDSLRAAPNGTYNRDSATAVLPGQTIVVETEPVSCIGGPRTFVYAKLVLDSVSATTGGAYIRAVVDPNCGYRSLVPGERPTS